MSEVAILIPCYNEAITIGAVIEDFAKYLPYATIYVYDNNSTDKTREIAKSYEGRYKVVVRSAPQQGKGNVVKLMFKEIKADIYLLVDGDSTYHASDARRLISAAETGTDMVLGNRLGASYKNVHWRRFHGFGNKLVCKLVNHFYNSDIKDVMTGYRALSSKFVKSIDVQSHEFEIETELCIHALKNNLSIRSVPVRYTDRPKGSMSKLNTIQDGIKVLEMIFRLR